MKDGGNYGNMSSIPREEYRRTGTVLNREYIHYMIPAMMSAIGISLSEFADSMVVSHLLDSDAFAIINLGVPVVFMVSMTYMITGLGGSLLFAECLGRKDKKKADNYFTISTALSVLVGVLLLVLLIVMHPILGDIFGCPGELRTEFDVYIRVISFFAPVGILLMHLTYFLPVIGRPFLSMGLVLSVNVINVILDFVFIGTFGMGCEGAALATLVSNVLVLIVAFLIWRIGKLALAFCRMQNRWKTVGEIVKKGLPAGSVQAGYMVTTIFCNFFMNQSFGINGVLAMSLFAQLDSFISIALTGIVDNNASFAAMLKGEGDYFGIRNLSKRVTVMILVACTALSVAFVLFPEHIAAIFNIHDPGALELIRKLILIYVLYYPLRCVLLVLRDIYNTLDRSMYATVLGILDKVVSIPLIGGILYLIVGGYGLIASFPISMVLILCLIAVINHRIVRKSDGRYSSVLLLDEGYPMKAVGSFSMKHLNDPAEVGRHIESSLNDASLEPGLANKICLAAEEMGLYIIDQCGADTAVDFLISTNGSEYILTCRSPGKPFCPIREKQGRMSPNELLLTGMFRIKHEYIFGLNSTSLTIGV